MLRKILFALVVAAVVVTALWRLGFLDERRAKDEAAELRDRAEEKAKEAAKAARDAVDPRR